MLENYTEIFDEIADQIQSITGDEVKCTRDILKIKFETNDDLPLDVVINIPVCVIVVSNIFLEDNEYHPQISLHDCFMIILTL